jgi:RNA polymerase II subunit A small phosphatase-like protein
MRIVVDGRPIQVYVLIRPGVLFFLQRLAAVYELVLYTASMNIYANPLVDTLDQDSLINMRLYREHCFSFQGSYIKDLSLLGRPMKDVIIVDNSPNAYFFHPENAVPILSWYDDLDDRCLFELIPLLEALSQVHDVRTVIPHFVDPATTLVDFPKAAFLLNETIRKQIANKTSSSQQKQRGPPQTREQEGAQANDKQVEEVNEDDDKKRMQDDKDDEEDDKKKGTPSKTGSRVKRSGKRDERGEEQPLNVDDEVSDDQDDHADKEAAPMNNSMNTTSS